MIYFAGVVMFEDGSILNDLFLERLNYFIYVVLLLIGLHAMISKNNFIKKLIGMAVFQTAIILFYVSIGVKAESGIPILGHAQHHEIVEEGKPSGEVINKEKFTNPLPHVLMLTAIVVGVATTALGLSFVVRIQEAYGTTEEDEIHELDSASANDRGERAA